MELNNKNIESLLEKYWDANTSLEEEKILLDYFSSDNVAPHLQKYGMLFDHYKDSRKESYAKNIVLKPRKNKTNIKWFSVAASLALMFGFYFGKQAYDKQQQEKQFAEIKKALELLSYNLNRGNDAIYAVSDNLLAGSNAVTQLDTYETTVVKVIEKVNR